MGKFIINLEVKTAAFIAAERRFLHDLFDGLQVRFETSTLHPDAFSLFFFLCSHKFLSTRSSGPNSKIFPYHHRDIWGIHAA